MDRLKVSGVLLVVVGAAIAVFVMRQQPPTLPTNTPAVEAPAETETGSKATSPGETTAVSPPPDDEPLATYIPPTDAQLGRGEAGLLKLPGGSVPTRYWAARDPTAPVFILVPDRGERAVDWQALVHARAQVFDAHTFAWDAPYLHGVGIEGDVHMAMTWASEVAPKSAAMVVIAVGAGLDRVLTEGADMDGLVVVSLAGKVATDPGNKAFSQPNLPWSMYRVGDVLGLTGAPLTVFPTTMMTRAVPLPADTTPVAGATHPSVRSNLLGWLFALVGTR